MMSTLIWAKVSLPVIFPAPENSLPVRLLGWGTFCCVPWDFSLQRIISFLICSFSGPCFKLPHPLVPPI